MLRELFFKEFEIKANNLSHCDGRQIIDDADDEQKTCRRNIAEGFKNEKQRGKDYVVKLKELQEKVKAEKDNPPPEEPLRKLKIVAHMNNS